MVTIAAGATISDTAANAPTVYVSSTAAGTTITNAGVISATMNNAYYTSSTSTVANTSVLVNAVGGMITDSSTSNAAVNLSGSASLQNAARSSRPEPATQSTTRVRAASPTRGL